MASSFRDLQQPVGNTVLEVDGIILYDTDALPTTPTSKTPTSITLPTPNPRPPQRASRLLLPASPPAPPRSLLQALHHSLNYLPVLQRLYTTPLDLLLKHLLSHPGLDDVLGTPPPRRWNASRSGLEKTEHLCFHPRLPLLALATTWARVHVYDLRGGGAFAPYFLVAADTPAEVTVTSLCWNTANQLAVGLDSGCVDVWTLDLSMQDLEEMRRVRHGPLFGLTPTPMRRRREYGSSGPPSFFQTGPSPATAAILSDMVAERTPSPRSSSSGDSASSSSSSSSPPLARLERVRLLPHQAQQTPFLGAITHAVFSPSGRHLAIGTATAGLWLHNVTLERSLRAYPRLALPAAAARCTALAWSASASRIVAAFASGLVLVLPVRENGAGSITVGGAVRFYPHLLLGVELGRGVREVLVVPAAATSASPTIVVALGGRQGIHVFRLVAESLRGATRGGETAGPLARIYSLALQAARHLFGGRTADLTAIHVGSLETPWTPFTSGRRRRRRKRRDTVTPATTATASDGTPGYGGAVEHMALDPSGQRLIVVFSGPQHHRSVVWFDAGRITAAAAALGALGDRKSVV